MGCHLSKRSRRSEYEPDVQPNIVSGRLSSGAASSPKKTKATTNGQTCQTDNIKACTGEATTATTVKPKPKLDPKDFMFMQLADQTKVKLPGTVNGQQFIIDGCQDSDLYVMDACAMVTIDDCKKCRIFIGPTESSIFMRNCSNCKLAGITRQLRTRDCHTCDILLYSRTRPIIESSSDISLGCYCTPYAGLAQQMQTAQLSPFHNFWSDVFDFTPDNHISNGTAAQSAQHSSKHWRLLPANVALRSLMGNMPEEAQQLIYGPSQATTTAVSLQDSSSQGPSAADLQAVICTAGQLCDAQQIATDCFAFVLFPPGQHAAVQRWLVGQFPCAQQPQTGQLSDNSRLGPSLAMNSNDQQMHAAGAVATTIEIEAAADVEDITIDALAEATNTEAVAHVAAEAPVVADASGQQQRRLLLRTNEAAVPADILQQIVTAAGWDKAQAKQLIAASKAAEACAGGNGKHKEACFIGVEVKCSSAVAKAELCKAAEALGALTCSSLQAAKLFRNLGTDG